MHKMWQGKNNRYRDDYALESVELAGAYDEPEVSILLNSTVLHCVVSCRIVTSWNCTTVRNDTRSRPDPRALAVLHVRKVH